MTIEPNWIPWGGGEWTVENHSSGYWILIHHGFQIPLHKVADILNNLKAKP